MIKELFTERRKRMKGLKKKVQKKCRRAGESLPQVWTNSIELFMSYNNNTKLKRDINSPVVRHNDDDDDDDDDFCI